ESIHVIHVEDILLVLEACTQLTSLILGSVEITDSDDSGDGPEDAIRGIDPDTHHPCIGRRLRHLELIDCVVSDDSLLQLLGIHSSDQEACVAHPLVSLELNLTDDNLVTSRSVTRILQECRSLEVMTMSNTDIVMAHIFREGQVWSCAESLREVRFVNKNSNYQGQMTSRDQEQIRDGLRSLSKLEYLCITGYPLGFAAVEGVEFAQSLRGADLSLEVEAPWDYFQDAADAQLLTRGNWWIKSQLPRQWSCVIKRGPPVHHEAGSEARANAAENNNIASGDRDNEQDERDMEEKGDEGDIEEWDRSGDGAEKKHGQTELQQLRAQVSDFVKQQADLLKQQKDSQKHNLELKKLLSRLMERLEKENKMTI
ncbi:hypothetical protein BGZ93_003342, partial [Podila epicladia]